MKLSGIYFVSELTFKGWKMKLEKRTGVLF